MKNNTILLAILCLFEFAGAEGIFPGGENYYRIASKAQELYNEKDYKGSAVLYDSLFQLYHNKGNRFEKYNAACVWSLSGNKDKAFYYLKQATTTKEWVNLPNILSDSDLDALHADPRWPKLIREIEIQNETAALKLNKPVMEQLDSIYKRDQYDRQNINVVEGKYGPQSKEMDSLWKKIHAQDLLNLVQVKNIIDTYGWLGPIEIGGQGASTLFLVIQHSDSSTQVKYLPLMRAAVKNENALPQNLALLEDRVLVAQGKEQVYGSQISQDSLGKGSFLPIADEANVNKRRATVGLGPIEDYAKYFGIIYTLSKVKI